MYIACVYYSNKILEIREIKKIVFYFIVFLDVYIQFIIEKNPHKITFIFGLKLSMMSIGYKINKSLTCKIT